MWLLQGKLTSFQKLIGESHRIGELKQIGESHRIFAYCCSERVPSINISYLFRFSFLLCEKFDLSITIMVLFCLSRYGDKTSSLHIIP